MSQADSVRYDRQLRLWGAGTQQRLQSSRLLCLGVNGLTFEIVKNAVLAGVGAVVVATALRPCSSEDHRTIHAVRQDDVDHQRPLGSVVTERLMRMNPLVSCVDAPLADVRENAEWVLEADAKVAGAHSLVVIAGDSVSQVRAQLAVLDELCCRGAPHNLVALVASYCAHATCGVFLTSTAYSKEDVAAKSLVAQWERWVALPNKQRPGDSEAAATPMSMQLCLLQLDLQEALLQSARRGSPRKASELPFRSVFAHAMRCAETRFGRVAAEGGFHGLLQVLLDSWLLSSRETNETEVPPATGRSGVVEFSVGGGFMAQQLIARLSRAAGVRDGDRPMKQSETAVARGVDGTSREEGSSGDSDAANAPPKAYSWVATWTPSVGNQECLVGSFEEG